MLPGSRKTGNTSTWATNQMKRRQPLVQHATESRQQWPNAHHDWSDIPPNVATVQNQSDITGSVRLWPVTSQVGSPKNDNNHEPGRRGLPTGMQWKAQWIQLAKSTCTNSQPTCHKQKPSNPNTMTKKSNQVKQVLRCSRMIHLVTTCCLWKSLIKNHGSPSFMLGGLHASVHWIGNLL